MTTIHINFPVSIKLSGLDKKALHDTVTRICQHYEALHPGRTMWVSGWGTSDSEIFNVEISERPKNLTLLEEYP